MDSTELTFQTSAPVNRASGAGVAEHVVERTRQAVERVGVLVVTREDLEVLVPAS